jgi:hypothetical protein
MIRLMWRIPVILSAAYLNQSLRFFLPICPYASVNPCLIQQLQSVRSFVVNPSCQIYGFNDNSRIYKDLFPIGLVPASQVLDRSVLDPDGPHIHCGSAQKHLSRNTDRLSILSKTSTSMIVPAWDKGMKRWGIKKGRRAVQSVVPV